MTLTYKGGTDCSKSSVICTSDGKALATKLAITIIGPEKLFVSDATAEEGPGATMDFRIWIPRPAKRVVTVDYATSNGTATEGEDYTRTSGTLTFAVGEQEKTVSVPVLEDSHNIDGETFTLTLSNPTNGAIADGTATGTIRN